MKHIISVLALVVLAGLSGCGQENLGTPISSPLTEPKVLNISSLGLDTHADLQVRQDWIDQERRISITIPSGRSIQVQLTHAMADGVKLRLKGQGGGVNSDLYLHLKVSR